MARQLHGIEKGIRFYLENSDTSVDYLIGSAVPNGLGDQASAAIGSFYQRVGTAGLYVKETNNGNAADWVLNGSGSTSIVPVFRNIVTRAATEEALSAGTTDPTSWADNESGLAYDDFAVGEFVIGDSDGTPALWEVTAVSSPNITLAAASTPLSDNDGFVVRAYLPDSPADQENQALVVYQDGAIIKLADVDWNFATGINLSTGYAAQNGTISNADSVEIAIEKLDGNQQDLTTLSGVAQGSTDLGSFTGTTIPDAQNTKQAIQALETAHEETDQNVDDLITLSGVAENSTDNGTMDSGSILSDNATTNALLKEVDAELTKQQGKSSAAGVTTIATLDSVIVDDVANAEWLITIENAASPANKRHVIFFAGHDGSAAADAVNVDDTEFAKLKQGANFNYSVSADLSGSAGAQVMRLRVSSTEPSGINVYAKRIETLF